MQKIIPHLWYDKEAKAAAVFYTGLFPDSEIKSVRIIENTPSGDAETIRFSLCGQAFAAISAGPYFKFNPSVSLMVACETAGEVDRLWRALSEGGSELMELGEYPFSKRYAWVIDRYGLSWQLMLREGQPAGQKITPNLLFSGTVNGQAEEAVRLYAEVFRDAEVGFISRYAAGEAEAEKARVNYASFRLFDVSFSAMDNAYDADYGFNEAFSLIVNCKDQREIDDLWAKLSAVPEAEQCGWLKDKFGFSWQITPDNMDELLFGGTDEENGRVTEAMLKMKKLDIAALRNARPGTSL